jgi:DnaJ-domain-containing protein 1
MVTPRDCLVHAEYCEKLAAQAGLERERARLREIAVKWRWLAQAFEDRLAGAEPTRPQGFGPAITPRPRRQPDDGDDL